MRPEQKTIFGKKPTVQCVDILLFDRYKLEFGRFKMKAIPTLGHTEAGTSFNAEGKLFTEDFFFIRDCGRKDFQQGDP